MISGIGHLFIYLQNESAHPHHIKENLPYSKFLRIRSICSKLDDYDKYGADFASFFTRRGYPSQVIKSAQQKARAFIRDQLLNPVVKTQVEDNLQNKMVAITQFHPTDSSFKDTIRKNWHLLGSPGTRVVHQTEIIYGIRHPKNLKDHLVRAQESLSKPTLWGLQQAPELCRQTRVSSADTAVIDRSGTIRSKFDRRKFRTRKKVCCKSNNLIYAIECTPEGLAWPVNRPLQKYHKGTDGLPSWSSFFQNEWPHRLTGCETVSLSFVKFLLMMGTDNTMNKQRGSGNTASTAITPSEWTEMTICQVETWCSPSLIKSFYHCHPNN